VGEAVLLADVGQYRAAVDRLQTVSGSTDRISTFRLVAGLRSAWATLKRRGPGSGTTFLVRRSEPISGPNAVHALAMLGLVEGHPMRIHFENRHKVLLFAQSH